jgi:uncharacterized protein (TIGR00303 family)
MIRYGNNHDRGRAWVQDLWGQQPAFVCVLGYTATAEIAGISSAGLTPEARKFTAIADAEFLATGQAKYFPLPKLAQGVSPAVIARAIVSALQLPLYLFNAGLLAALPIPHIDLKGLPAQCLTTGSALPISTVNHLFEQGLAWGEKLSKIHPYLVIGECVVAGTTTALALLEALGIPARQRVGSSHPICNHHQKWTIVQQGLAKLAEETDPLQIVSKLGDPMQIVVAGMAIAGCRHTKILLAGGSQMLAVYALSRAISRHQKLAWHPSQIAIGTTKWVWEDASTDIPRLCQEIPEVPVLVSELSLRDSAYPQLQIYESGFVKEGVGAGGALIAAHLYQNWQKAKMQRTIEEMVALL